MFVLKLAVDCAPKFVKAAADVVAPVPPFSIATIPVTLVAVPDTLPVIVFVTFKFVNVPTEVKDELTTVEFKEVPDKVPAAAVTVISVEPSNATPLMFFVAANLVAVDALPVKAAVIVPALKFPVASRATIVFAVLLFVAVVAELLTLPAVAMVANLLSTIPAVAEMSSFAMVPSAILAVVTALAANLSVEIAELVITGAVADEPVPAKSPANCILPVADVDAFGAPVETVAST